MRKEEGEDKRRQEKRNNALIRQHGDTISAVVSCLLCTLFAEFGKEAKACDGWPGEDDGVLAGDILAKLLGHEAVKLRLVLQGGQTVRTLALLQMP